MRKKIYFYSKKWSTYFIFFHTYFLNQNLFLNKKKKFLKKTLYGPLTNIIRPLNIDSGIDYR